MNNIPKEPSTPRCMDEGVQVLWNKTRHSLQEHYHEFEDRVRKSPSTAMVGAAVAGYLLHRLPVRAILITQFRVLSALTPPALLLFGAAKLYRLLQKRELTKPA